MSEEDSGNAAGELGGDVGKGVPTMDAAEPEIGEGDGRVQVGPSAAAEGRANNEICGDRDSDAHESRIPRAKTRAAQRRSGAIEQGAAEADAQHQRASSAASIRYSFQWVRTASRKRQMEQGVDCYEREDIGELEDVGNPRMPRQSLG